jgi:hypothetical protein
VTPVDFEPTIPAIKLPLIQTLHQTATGISKYPVLKIKQGTRMLCKIPYRENLLKYIERFKTHHERFGMNKCLKYQQSTQLKIY